MGPAPQENPASGRSGFTLVELVIVIAILGILAGLAVPGFRQFVARSKRSEAYTALVAIYDSETEYFASNGRFASTFDDLGFDLLGGVRVDPSTIQGPYYTYSLATLNGAANFQAVANGDIDPGSPVRDILVVGK
ncbi:MAG: type IV pilin protein [Myxococcota bacterium]